jgi:hypothetical protein
MMQFRAIRMLATGAAAVTLAALGGCADGIELQGGVFDALGVSTTSITGKRADSTKVAARPGLVLPPSTDRLPVPGDDVTTGSAAWPVDPDQAKKVDRATLEAQQKAVCDKAALDEKVRKTATSVEGPLGPCDPSVLRGMFGASNPLDKL